MKLFSGLLLFFCLIKTNLKAQTINAPSQLMYPANQNLVSDYLSEGAGASHIFGFFYLDIDTDKDGTVDFFETGPNDDLDGDGLINSADPDDDNDGILDGADTQPIGINSMPATAFKNGTVAAANGATGGDYWQFVPNSTIASGPLMGYFQLPGTYLYIDNNTNEIPDILEYATGANVMPPYTIDAGFSTSHLLLGAFEGLLGEWEYSGSPGSTPQERSHLSGSTIFRLCDDDGGTGTTIHYTNNAPYNVTDIYSSTNAQPDYNIYGTTDETDPAIPNSLKHDDAMGERRWRYSWFGPKVAANREIVFFLNTFWFSGGSQVNTYYSRPDFNPDTPPTTPNRNGSTTGTNYGGSGMGAWFPHFQNTSDHDQLAAAVFGAGTVWTDIATAAPNPIAVNTANQAWVDQFENWTPERRIVQYISLSAWLNFTSVNAENILNQRYGVDLNSDNRNAIIRAVNGKLPHFLIVTPTSNPLDWIVGIEDLFGGGDRDFEDVAFYTTSLDTEIDIQGNGMSITDGGGNSPSTANHTNFGDACIGTPITRTFSVLNTDLAELVLTGSPAVSISGSTDFMVSLQPATSIIGGQSTTFEIQFSPSSAGLKNAVVSIENNDSDEGTYTFNIQGTGLNTPIVTTTNQNVCNGDVIMLSASFVVGGSYSWAGPNSFMSSLQNPLVTNSADKSLHEGMYTVVVTDGSSCTASATATIIVDNELPTANCQNITINLDINGMRTLLPSEVDNSSSDNCGIGNTQVSPNSFNCSDAGNTVPVMLTVTDNSGNMNECTAMVTIQDNMPPIAICQDLTIQLDANGNASITENEVNNGSTDNCGISSLAISNSAFNCSHVSMVNSTSLIVIDVNGNTANCSANITVLDNMAPIAICQDLTIQLDANGNTSITASQVNNGSSDNCDINSLVISANSFDCSNVGTTNSTTLTVFDVNGNFSSCAASISVLDNLAPIAICQDLTIQLDANGNASINENEVNNGSSDNCGISSLAISNSAFNCSHVSMVNSTSLTVIDVNGNTANCSANITVLDNMAPIAICQDLTIQLDANGDASITENEVNNGSSDNCGINSLGISNSAFNCSHVGMANSTALTVIDVNGNTANCSANITVLDNMAPIAICQDLTLQLDANGNASITENDVNNGSSDNCGVNSLAISTSAFNCSHVGLTNSTSLTVTDVNGNTANCSANITVLDNMAPIAICQDLTLQLDANGNASITENDVNNGSSDNCGINSLALSNSAFDCSNVDISNSTTLSVTDVNGNTSNCSASITVLDNIAPTAICQDLTIQLDVNGNASITANQVDNGSNDNCQITNQTLSESTFNCSHIGLQSTNLTVSDQSGNEDSCTSNINIEDNVPPSMVCVNIDLNLDENGEGSITPDEVDGGTYDACGIASLSISNTSFNCENLGLNTVSITATDVNGNAASCIAQVNVIDPIPASILCRPPINTIADDGACGKTELIMLPPFVLAENCTVEGIVNNAPSFFPLGTTIVTWSATDAGGNISTCEQTVTISDFSAPQIECGNTFITQVTEYQCSFPSYLLEEPTASDNCGAVNVSSDAPAILEIGSHTITWTATDASGNISQCVQQAEIWDLISPEFDNCPELIEVEAEDQNGATVFWQSISASDNCGEVILYSTHDSGDFFPLGETVVTYWAYDGFASPSECHFIVSVTPTQVDLSIDCLEYLEISVEDAMNWESVLWNPPLLESTCEDCEPLDSDGLVYLGSFLGHQYYTYENGDLSWQESNTLATDIGANLLIINSPYESQFIQSVTGENDYFLGINNLNINNEFEWIDGEIAEEATFGDNFFSNIPSGSTVILNEEGDWEIVSLNGTNAYPIFEIACIELEMEIIETEDSNFPSPNSSVQVLYQATDLCGNVSSCGFDVHLSSQGVSYCQEGSIPTNEEDQNWIDAVIVNDFTNESGNDDGYAYFANAPIFLNTGEDINWAAKFHKSDEDLPLFCRVWIDFNKDGDFYDAGELIHEDFITEDLNFVYALPNVASPIKTRMRVAIAPQHYPEPCGTFLNGEMEDYTLFIMNQNQNGNLNQNLSIYPNPVSQFLYVNLKSSVLTDDAQLIIHNSLGQEIFSRKLLKETEELRVDLSQFQIKNGIYFLTIQRKGKNLSKRFVYDKEYLLR